MDEAKEADDVGRFLYAVENAPMRRWPFEHFTASDLLDPSLVRDVRDFDLRHFTSLRARKGIGISDKRFGYNLLPDDHPDDSAALHRLRRLFASSLVARALMRRFAGSIAKRVRVDGGVAIRKSLDLLVDRSGYDLRPHVDAPGKLVTLILYLDDEPDGISLGTSIYMPKDREQMRRLELESQREGRAPHRQRVDFIRVATVPHRANTALCFAPGLNSYHGVEPVPGTDAARYLLQYHVLIADHAELVHEGYGPATISAPAMEASVVPALYPPPALP